MPNNLFNSMQQNNIQGAYNIFQQNPMKFLMDRQIDIPQEYMNNPQQAVQYLLNTGKMSQSTLEQIKQKAKMLGFNI